jgi:hypothetical protein
MEYLNAKEPAEGQSAAFKIVETLFPKLTDEQRESLAPAPMPGSEAGDDGVADDPPGIDEAAGLPKAGRKVEDLDARYKAWKLRWEK